mmetsp:Transcript_8594/g.18536  ORF Transcript_8594/g.18536 Transcript_8594/m.18536 type:complete len:96 (-) Transcript_8594:88-375(-)
MLGFCFVLMGICVCVLSFLLAPKEIRFELFLGVAALVFVGLGIVLLLESPKRFENGHGKPDEEDISEAWLSSVLLALITSSSMESIFLIFQIEKQ